MNRNTRLAADNASVLAIVAWTAGQKGRKCGSLTQGPLLAPVRAWIDGVHIANWGLAILFGCGFCALWCFAYGGLALAACMRTRSAETAQGMAPLFFPILFMSTAVMPKELLPSWLRTIAEYNPVSYVADAMRAANGGHVDGAATWKALLGIAVVAAVTQVLVVRARRGVAAD